MNLRQCWVLLCLSIFPIGCTVVVQPPPPYASDNDSQVVHITFELNKHHEGDAPVVVAPTPPPKPTPPVAEAQPVTPPPVMPLPTNHPGDKCPLFILPVPGAQPQKPDLTDPKYKSQADAEAAVKGYIRALRLYITDERKRLEEAHSKYLARCTQKNT